MDFNQDCAMIEGKLFHFAKKDLVLIAQLLAFCLVGFQRLSIEKRRKPQLV
jgi:hypothetical protein